MLVISLLVPVSYPLRQSANQQSQLSMQSDLGVHAPVHSQANSGGQQCACRRGSTGSSLVCLYHLASCQESLRSVELSGQCSSALVATASGCSAATVEHQCQSKAAQTTMIAIIITRSSTYC